MATKSHSWSEFKQAAEQGTGNAVGDKRIFAVNPTVMIRVRPVSTKSVTDNATGQTTEQLSPSPFMLFCTDDAGRDAALKWFDDFFKSNSLERHDQNGIRVEVFMLNTETTKTFLPAGGSGAAASGDKNALFAKFKAMAPDQRMQALTAMKAAGCDPVLLSELVIASM